MTRFSRLTAPALLASLGMLSASGVLAAEAKPSFESLDKNGDGKISLNEASSHDALFVAFKSLDTNKDGELTPAEFAKYK
jgi:Ca2+-binding EF-hand superfamily protein